VSSAFSQIIKGGGGRERLSKLAASAYVLNELTSIPSNIIHYISRFIPKDQNNNIQGEHIHSFIPIPLGTGL